MLEQNDFDYVLAEDLNDYVVKFAKYAQILKNTSSSKKMTNKRLFLMKDPAVVEKG